MGSTVLFVDDDTDLLAGLGRALRRESFQVLAATSARQAMDLMEHHRVDVIVSDERMPEISGNDFLAQVRLLHPGVVRMMLTGHASLDGALQAINEGRIFRYLLKPCAVEELVQAVHQGLGQKRLMDRCRRALQVLGRQSALLAQIGRDHPAVLREAQGRAGLAGAPPGPADSVEELAALLALGLDGAEGVLGPPAPAP